MKELIIPTKKNSYKPYLLKKGLLVFYTVILVVVNTFGGFLGISKIAASNVNSTSIISLTNQERSAAGLNTLNQNSKLATAAKAKAENMFDEQYWDHFGPNGETPWQFITGAGYNYVYAGENLAKGFRTSEGVVEAWMASPTHRDNILSKNYKDIGVAVMTGVLLGKETTLVVQMFGNLTSEIQGSTSKTPAPVTKSPVIESGQIKAISITHPKAGDILKDNTMLIKGEVQGDKEEYTVELYDLEKKISQIEGENDTWEYTSQEEWKDGSHQVEARVKGTTVKSEQISFTVDTSAPVIERESLTVIKEEENIVISFEVDEPWQEVKIVSGEKELAFLSAEVEEIRLEDFEAGEKVVLHITDYAGNTSELDISEYFIEGESEEYNNFNFVLLFNSIKTTEGISVVLVLFLLILISIEVAVLWKKGKLSRGIGDIFVVALWITVLAIGIFKGFGGVAL